MRGLISKCLLILILPFGSFAQNSYLPLHRDILLYTTSKSDSTTGFHSSIKPYLKSDLVIDTSLHRTHISRQSIGSTKYKSFNLTLRPLVIAMYGAGSGHVSRTSAGAELRLNAGNNLSFCVSYLVTMQYFPSQYSALLDSGYIPHYGQFLSKSKNNVFTYQDFTGYLSWSPFRFMNIQLGKDRNFWGDGYRSLFLSDNSNSYPFFKTTFSAWHIKYVSLLTFLKDVNLPGSPSNLYPKFSAMHYLSWNVTHHLNISFFESVTFKGRDSTDFTAFDFQYINPVVFYRPVEFSVGSPGKMHLGLGASYNFFDTYKLYGQFLLGEFILKEFLGGNGWWGNKYGVQLGLQSSEAFNIRGLHLLAEANMVRPYTYSHSNTLTNYGYEMQPLAHPLGANFIEGLVEAKYYLNKNIFSFTLIHSIAGLDSAKIDFGQNIYRNYTSRPSDYGIKLLQGLRSNYTAFNVSYARLLVPKWDLTIEGGMNGSFIEILGHGQLENYFYISLKTLLNNDESFIH